MTTERDCNFCDVPRATGRCKHIIVTHDQVRMSLQCWYDLVDELNRLRGLEAALEDGKLKWHV